MLTASALVLIVNITIMLIASVLVLIVNITEMLIIMLIMLIIMLTEICKNFKFLSPTQTKYFL